MLKRKNIISILIIFIFVVLVPSFTFADVNGNDNYDINSIKQLEEEISEKTDKNNELTKTEGKEIIDNSDPQVLTEYIADSYDIAMKKGSEIVNDPEFCLDGEDEKVVKVEVSEGVNMEISLIDEEEEDSLLGSVGKYLSNVIAAPSYAASGSSAQTLTKAYGARKYTASLKLTLAGITFAKLCLVNHYKISSNGLDLTSADVAGTTAYLVADVTSAKATKKDTVARSVGTDIDCRGDYTVRVTVPYLGINVQTKYADLINYVKLVSLNKTNKNAKVKQHMSFTY